MRFAALFLLFPSAVSAAEALVQDRTHESQVLGESRNYRIFLPPDYGTSNKRYPVIYWFHGHSERHNQPAASPTTAITTRVAIMAAIRSRPMSALTT